MRIVQVVVEVHVSDLNLDDDTRYRLYCNNDLLIERKWRWTKNHYIEEEIWLNLDYGVIVEISLIPILFNNSTTKFKFKNCSIQTPPYNIKSITDYSFIFSI